MTQLANTDAVTDTPKRKRRVLRTPLDTLIIAVARRVGGSRAKEVERFLKFAVVGSIGAMVDLGTSFILLRTVLDPRSTLEVLIAATISFTAAVLSNFTWNRYWTYPDSRSRPIRRQLVQFFIVSTIGWTGRTIWLSFAKPLFGDIAADLVARFDLELSEVDAALGGAMVAILLGIFVVMIWNFFVNRYWTYNDVD